MKVDIEDIKKELDCYVAQLEDELKNSRLPDEYYMLDAVERVCVSVQKNLDILALCEQRVNDKRKEKKDCDNL